MEKSEELGASKMSKDPNIPDRSYGDFYCIMCDSHMNCPEMWTAHVTGKRHLKNLDDGDVKSKYEDVDDESTVNSELRNVKDDPVVGLSYIHEIRRWEPNFPPFYKCFLCHANFATVPVVIEHILSLKHRQNYMREKNPAEYKLLDATNLRNEHLEILVQDAVLKMEQKYGRGEIKVKREKPKVLSHPAFYKKEFGSAGDYLRRAEHGNLWRNRVCDIKSEKFEGHEPQNLRVQSQIKTDHDTIRVPLKEGTPCIRSHQSDVNVLPHEMKKEAETSIDSAEFRQGVNKIPTKTFLRSILTQMDNMTVEGIEELNLLAEFIAKADDLLRKKLPHAYQTPSKLKYENDTAPSASTDPASVKSEIQ